jgi:hypothetical protein
MVVDNRLTKLARGVTAQTAAKAYARRAEGAALTEAERAHAAELEATIEAMFLMAAVDGQVAEDEIAQLAGSLQAILDLSGGGARSSATKHRIDVDATLASLAAALERDGWTARLDAVAARLLTDESRAFAFRLAAAVAFVDDHVAHAEAAAIDALGAALQLDRETTQQILGDVQETLFQE